MNAEMGHKAAILRFYANQRNWGPNKDIGAELYLMKNT